MVLGFAIFSHKNAVSHQSGIFFFLRFIGALITVNKWLTINFTAENCSMCFANNHQKNDEKNVCEKRVAYIIITLRCLPINLMCIPLASPRAPSQQLFSIFYFLSYRVSKSQTWSSLKRNIKFVKEKTMKRTWELNPCWKNMKSSSKLRSVDCFDSEFLSSGRSLNDVFVCWYPDEFCAIKQSVAAVWHLNRSLVARTRRWPGLGLIKPPTIPQCV